MWEKLKLCEVTVKSKRGQHATFVRVRSVTSPLNKRATSLTNANPSRCPFARGEETKAFDCVTARSAEYRYRYPAP